MDDWFVTVCDACGRASCWHGEWLCADARTAGTRVARASDLRALGAEHPARFSRERIAEVEGGTPPLLTPEDA